MKEESKIGVIVRGIKLPIIREGDDLKNTILCSLFSVVHNEEVSFKDRDIIGITESIVARSEGNYVTVDQVAQNIVSIVGKKPRTIGVIWPIYSRNRFSLILKAISRVAEEKVRILLNVGSDEVGNDHINPYTDVNIDEFYREIVEGEGKECEIILSDEPEVISEDINIVCGFHNYREVESLYPKDQVITLADICSVKTSDHGYNEEFGLLGCNKMSEELLKLFPRYETCKDLVEGIKESILSNFGKKVEVMVYADGAYKDPVSGIWEFADPVVCPAYTSGLSGTPNEVKIKYLADGDFSDLSGSELDKAIRKRIKENAGKDLKGNMVSQGTTPRHYTDLLGSLMDLCSGSGSKGTPVIWIQNYFKTY